MKTKEEISKYAKGFAREHFYSYDDVPWEPFENESKDWLEEQVQDLADAIVKAMLWAQGGE